MGRIKIFKFPDRIAGWRSSMKFRPTSDVYLDYCPGAAPPNAPVFEFEPFNFLSLKQDWDAWISAGDPTPSRMRWTASAHRWIHSLVGER
jgi:hypothetical protein